MLKNNLLLFFCVALFCVLTATNFVTGQHQLFNLEPYPDGLLYVVPSFSFASGTGWQISTVGDTLKPWVPPLYSLFLLPLFIITKIVSTFYLTNIILGVGTVILLYKLVERITGSTKAAFLSSLLYLSHAVIIWLLSVPLSENAALLLLLTTIYVLTNPRKSSLWAVVTAISLSALVFVRYDLGLVSVVLGAHVLITLQLTKAWKHLVFFIVTVITMLSLFYATQLHNPYPVISSFGTLTEAGIGKEIIAFDVAHIPESTQFYFKAVSGLETKLLWLTSPVIGYGVWLLIVPLILFKKNLTTKQRSASFMVLLTIVAVLLPHLFFYALDARYLILLIPLIVILAGLGLELVLKRQIFHITGLLFTVALLGTIVPQRQLWRSSLTANWLQRSTGWNQVSVRELNQSAALLSEKKINLITSLPPQLFLLNKSTHIQPLPLSIYQEFLSKDQLVWDIKFEQRPVSQFSLMNRYHQALESGESLYITNAYVTQLNEVITDYENFSNQFELELVSTGCENACNLYQLRKKDATMDSNEI